ncbi:hypothetical protein ABMA70_01885 [Halobacteriovorax sp. XZX-3]|uniref:hypothetical protein n=1 Tax=unclassified Halobacteriovorax TaxID=2639665 RepID=UPI000CD16A1E|nr:hypothetical protein [Halobacteriovorax sp. DA5]POB14496.1 hypothetical protein C0Z22_05230 [Halobacteriovorax sp. DA5]
MFAALIKAAIFYFIFIQIRKILRNTGVLSGSKPTTQKYQQHEHTSYRSGQNQSGTGPASDKDVIEADYRIID